ncbi:uncharacterized protein LOC132547378 [Ylistrum balloti]|uniref:uncharacterized protein LOC132547378 n=1 Tax=Ylistrum balloti TaxID=509963 RepID=UPI0029059489|nr:uncharacterized protein LOC132547378 [Ylistrum balloti]
MCATNIPNVFRELKKLKDFKLKLHVDETVTPVAQRMYGVPYSLREKVTKKIEELESLDIIEPVYSPSQWISPVSVVPKPDSDIELDSESRDITTFVTHAGLYRYKRLMFGINAAPELYQHIISQIFHDIEGVESISDDIVVHGTTKEEHDQSARYIPDLATISEPLRKLVRKSVTFVWGRKQHESFEKLKDCLANASVLGHFSLNAKKTTVVTDANNVGLAAILIQEDSSGQSKVISYASRSLSDVERRYPTTEKEALAVVWGCDKFKLYLVGIPFDLVTDPKPLEAIYGPKSKPNARIERWIMKLMPYSPV